MSRGITITIADGNVRIEATGYKGGNCKKATAPLHSALIGKSEKSELKPEFFEQDVKAVTLQRELER
jgi:hypothetical protein